MATGAYSAIASRLENLSALWADATEEDRLQIAAGLIDAVWVDLDGNKVLGIQPADEYHRLGMALPAVWSFCGTDGDQIHGFDTYVTQEPAAGAPVFPTHFPLWVVPSAAPAPAKSRPPRVDPALWTGVTPLRRTTADPHTAC